MGWASMSLRKMTLKQRINSIQQRLMNLSQEEQSMYDSSSYATQAVGLEKTNALNNLYQTYQNRVNIISQQYGGGTSVQDLSNYNALLQQEQLSLQYNQMVQNSLFQSKETAMQNQVNQDQTRLELEQEQLETQLEAAQAEYESLDQACSSDIKNGAINLGG